MIAAEAAADVPATPARPSDAWVPWLLLAGGLAGVIPWFAGLVMLWRSGTWSRREKILGTFLLPGALLGFVGVLFLPGSTTECTTGGSSTAAGPSPEHCTTHGVAVPPAVGILVFLLVLFGPIVTAMRLEAVRRRALAP